MYFATSNDEPTLFVAAQTRDHLKKSIRSALESIFSDREEMCVYATPAEHDGYSDGAWAVAPTR